MQSSYESRRNLASHIPFYFQAAVAHTAVSHWEPDSTLQVFPTFTSSRTCALRPQPHPRGHTAPRPRDITITGAEGMFLTATLDRLKSSLAALPPGKTAVEPQGRVHPQPPPDIPSETPARTLCARARTRTPPWVPRGSQVEKESCGAERGHGRLCSQVFSPP